MGVTGPSDKSYLLKKISSELIQPFSGLLEKDRAVEVPVVEDSKVNKRKQKTMDKNQETSYGYENEDEYDLDDEAYEEAIEKEHFNFNDSEMETYKKLVEFRKNQIAKYDPKWVKNNEADEEGSFDLDLDELSVFDWPLPTGKETLNAEELHVLTDLYQKLSVDSKKLFYLPSTLLYCMIPVMSREHKDLLIIPQKLVKFDESIQTLWTDNKHWVVPVAEKLMEQQPNLAQIMKLSWSRSSLENRIKIFYNTINIDMLRSDPEFKSLFDYWDKIFGSGTFPERVEYELRRYLYNQREKLAKIWVELDNIITKTQSEIKMVNAMTIEPIYLEQNIKFRDKLQGFESSSVLVDNYRIPLSENPEDSTFFQMIVDDVNNVELAAVIRQLLLPSEMTLTHDERIQDRRMELVREVRSRGFQRDPTVALQEKNEDKVLIEANGETAFVHPQLLNYLEKKNNSHLLEDQIKSEIDQKLNKYLAQWRELVSDRDEIVDKISLCLKNLNDKNLSSNFVSNDNKDNSSLNSLSVEPNIQHETDESCLNSNAVEEFFKSIPHVDLKEIMNDVEKNIGGPLGPKGEMNFDQEVSSLPYQSELAIASQKELDASENPTEDHENVDNATFLNQNLVKLNKKIRSKKLSRLLNQFDNKSLFYLNLYKFTKLLSGNFSEIQSELKEIETLIVNYFNKENEYNSSFENFDEEIAQKFKIETFQQYLDSSKTSHQAVPEQDSLNENTEFAEKPLFYTDREVKKVNDYSQLWEPNISDEVVLDEEQKIRDFQVTKHNLRDMFLATDQIDSAKKEELRLFATKRMQGIQAVPPEGFFDTENQGELNIVPGSDEYDFSHNQNQNVDGLDSTNHFDDQSERKDDNQKSYRSQGNLQTDWFETSPGIAVNDPDINFSNITSSIHAIQQKLDVYEDSVLPKLLEDRQEAIAKKLTEDAPHVLEILQKSAEEAGEWMNSLNDNQELNEQITNFHFRAEKVGSEEIDGEFENTIAGSLNFALPDEMVLPEEIYEFDDQTQIEAVEDLNPSEIVTDQDLLDEFGSSIVSDDIPVGKYWIQKEMASDMVKGYIRTDDEITPYYSDSSALVEQAVKEIEKSDSDLDGNPTLKLLKNIERLDLAEKLNNDESIMTLLERSLRNLRMSKDVVYNQANAIMSTEDKLDSIFESAQKQTQIDMENPELTNMDSVKKLEETYGKPVELNLDKPLTPEEYLEDLKLTVYSRNSVLKPVQTPEELEINALRRTTLEHIGPYLNENFFKKPKSKTLLEEEFEEFEEVKVQKQEEAQLYVKNCYDVDEIYSHEHINKYVVFSNEELKKYFSEGLGGKLVSREFSGTNTNGIMVRAYVLDTINYLVKCQKASFPVESKEYAPIILHGYIGSGKSSTLALTIHWARLSNWFVVYIPDTWVWMNTGGFLDYSKKRKKWDQPRLAKQFFGNLINSHQNELSNIKLKSSLSKSWNLKENNLLALVEFGFTFQEYAGDVFDAVTREIELITEYPVLIAIDNYNYLYNKSINFADPNSKSYVKAPIQAEQLSMASWLYKAHRNLYLANGIVAVALSGSSSMNNFYKNSADDLWKYIDVLPYSMTEMENVLRYYYETKWIHTRVSSGSVSHKYLYQLTSGFPAEIWNYTKRL